ncbi:MAG: ABC transporter permease [Thermoleophilaceae bacterium]|nr:ABC transporter permease [Thermoleophilaceae bacterium]
MGGLGAYGRVVWVIARRAIARTYRRPQLLMPLFLVPTMFLAVTAGGAARSIDLPGFPPVDNFFHFALAGAIAQSTMLGGLIVGTALSMDVDNGFFDRMIVSPVPRSALVLGRLLAGAIIGFGQGMFYLAIGMLFGARVEAGPLGAVIVCMLGALTAVAIGGLAVSLALRAQAQWVQGAFPLVFVGLFLSSAFFPRALLTGPAATIADYNPMSYIVEGIRDPIISTISWNIVGTAIAVAITFSCITVAIAIRGLRRHAGAV